MVHANLNSNKGFTLIEAIVSMLILSILLIGLLASFLKAIDINVYNYLRDEAVKIAQFELEECRNKPFSNIVNSNSTVNVQFRNSNYAYNVVRTVNDLVGMKEVKVQVDWSYKGRNCSYSVSTVIRDQSNY